MKSGSSALNRPHRACCVEPEKGGGVSGRSGLAAALLLMVNPEPSILPTHLFIEPIFLAFWVPLWVFSNDYRIRRNQAKIAKFSRVKMCQRMICEKRTNRKMENRPNLSKMSLETSLTPLQTRGKLNAY